MFCRRPVSRRIFNTNHTDVPKRTLGCGAVVSLVTAGAIVGARQLGNINPSIVHICRKGPVIQYKTIGGHKCKGKFCKICGNKVPYIAEEKAVPYPEAMSIKDAERLWMNVVFAQSSLWNFVSSAVFDKDMYTVIGDYWGPDHYTHSWGEEYCNPTCNKLFKLGYDINDIANLGGSQREWAKGFARDQLRLQKLNQSVIDFANKDV